MGHCKDSPEEPYKHPKRTQTRNGKERKTLVCEMISIFAEEQ